MSLLKTKERIMYQKLNIYLNGKYLCSSNWYRSIKKAKEEFISGKQVTIQGLYSKSYVIQEKDKIQITKGNNFLR